MSFNRVTALESQVLVNFEEKSNVQIASELDQELKARENSEWKKLEREILTSEAPRQSSQKKEIGKGRLVERKDVKSSNKAID